MIIDCLSDLHGYYPELEGGDLLIVAGDLTAKHTFNEYAFKFISWLSKQDYKRKIVIGGNHDTFLGNGAENAMEDFCDYLCDSGTEFEGLKIWGSPWTLNFEGQNPKCKAFGLDTEEELKAKWDLIPDDIGILITHSPPYGILDKTIEGKNVGSKSLRKVMNKIKPKLWIVGHIHEAYGEFKDVTLTGNQFHFVNASHVNERYNPVNDPIRVIL